MVNPECKISSLDIELFNHVSFTQIISEFSLYTRFWKRWRLQTVWLDTSSRLILFKPLGLRTKLFNWLFWKRIPVEFQAGPGLVAISPASRIHKRRCKLLFAMLNWRPCLWLDMRGKVDLRKVLSRVEDQIQHNRLDIDSSSGEMLQIFWGIVLSLGWISDGFGLIDNQKVKIRKKRYPKTLLSIINHKSTESTPISTRYTFFASSMNLLLPKSVCYIPDPSAIAINCQPS
jgi:hypothetical protein